MIIDAHHHLWDPATGDYRWMTGPYEPLRRRYSVQDLRPHLATHDVAATVVVQARADPAETFDLLSIAEHTDVIVGVVGWVDLTAPDVPEQLNRLGAALGGRFLVGLRHDATSEPNPNWLIDPVVEANLGHVSERDLTFDLEITTRELSAAALLAQCHPELRFVVDHVAKPPIAQGWSTEWAEGMRRLGTFANVWCKVSGLVTEADWSNWSPQQLVPYIDHALVVFGAGRLLFGSDWPVCELAGNYTEVVQTMRAALSTLTADERDSILYRNAIACYGLTLPSPSTPQSHNYEVRKLA